MLPISINDNNPDSASIAEKTQIRMDVSLFDISASMYPNAIATNYRVTEQVVTIPIDNLPTTSSYYTPLYTEKLNYEVWLNRVNKNFQELD